MLLSHSCAVTNSTRGPKFDFLPLVVSFSCHFPYSSSDVEWNGYLEEAEWAVITFKERVMSLD